MCSKNINGKKTNAGLQYNAKELKIQTYTKYIFLKFSFLIFFTKKYKETKRNNHPKFAEVPKYTLDI